jgi:RsiW-degrading membrane proteinase PrsW (M82 family)
LGGALPTLAWLLFWLKEDSKNPEPKRMIAVAFVGGIIAVVVALYLERLAYSINIKHLLSFEWYGQLMTWLQNYARMNGEVFEKLTLVTIFAPIIEESIKYVFAWALVLRSRYDDEPIDPVIYMITIALGFAALENLMFLIEPFTKNDIAIGIMNGNMRFVGATLLHTMSSAAIGMFIAFNFFDSKIKKFLWTIAGIISAILLHSLFNFFMIGNSSNASFMGLQYLWVVVIIVLLLFEKIKRVKNRSVSRQELD